jgi:fermentation-respiration switch protein FrsA (DUF1100 family)
MKDSSHTLSPKLDRPEVSNNLFFPQPAWSAPASRQGTHDVLIPVEPGVSIGARYHIVERSVPAILFFHGNGEIVDDYDDTASLYGRLGLSFLPVDYRGYGHSTGHPSVSTMLRDAHAVLDHARAWLRREGCTGPLVVMGRSLGSASALELAACAPESIDGLIIESGFAHSQTLLNLVGVDMEEAAIAESEAFRHLEKIGRFRRPTLIIHAELDNILPFADGHDLYQAAGAEKKRLLMIPGANHNNIFSVGMSEYLQALREFMAELR